MKRVKAENYRNNDKDKGSGSPIHIERKVFDCGGYEWVIPAAYSDAQEINIDICRRIPVEALRSFRDKWGDKDRALLTQEQSALRNCDDPLRLPVKFSIEINGEEIRGSGWNKTVWQPDDSGEGNIRAKELLQLYGLAPDSAWLFYRAVFHWEREMADIKSMSLLLSSNRVTRPSGYRFTTAVNCTPFTVTVPHRCREKEYRLHILSCRCKTMDDLECGMPDMHRGESGLVLPKKYYVLEYRTESDGKSGEAAGSREDILTVHDCARPDSPIRNKTTVSSIAASVIGGAAGATVLTQGETRAACSSMYFEEKPEIEWYVGIASVPFQPVQMEI